ncbi:MFS transporter [Ancylobacter terrae]|uniref:MFS transporter n=1 Tax=Ancylobacter sp. sgz301288 TaxID=3342077 RepID=UPI00385EB1B2
MTAMAETAERTAGITYFLLAAAAGAGAANLYYAQPLIALIAPDIGLDETWASLIVTLGQVGYIAGLLFIVPLGDLHENRGLIVTMLVVAAAGLLIAWSAPAAGLFLAAAFLFGIGSVVAQIAVPFAAHLAPPEERGRRVGFVVSGLMTGILLARPLSSFIAAAIGWHGVFACAAALMLLLALALRLTLPKRHPGSTAGYAALVGSLVPLMRRTPLLQRRALYQATMFGAFTLFWSAVPLLLSGPDFGYGQDRIALFALAGAAGVVASPIAGRMADRGHGRLGTGIAFVTAILGFAMTAIGAAYGSVVALAIGAVVLDGAATANLVFGQRALFMLDPAIRSRLNALYIGSFFAGGALGSAIASPLYTAGGWPLVTVAGIAGLALGGGFFLRNLRAA